MTAVQNVLENKQLVHIASEIIVLIGLTFYFSSKNKKLLSHIEGLSQRLEDQEDRIQKLEDSKASMEQTIKQLENNLNLLTQRCRESFTEIDRRLFNMADSSVKVPLASVDPPKPRPVISSQRPVHVKSVIKVPMESIKTEPLVKFSPEAKVKKTEKVEVIEDDPSDAEDDQEEVEPSEEDQDSPEEDEIDSDDADNSDLDKEIAIELRDISSHSKPVK